MDSKKQLQDLIKKIEQKNWQDGQAKDVMNTIGGKIIEELKPAFDELAKGMAEAMLKQFETGIKALKIDVPEIKSPEVTMPNFPDFPAWPSFPEIKVPIPQVTLNPTFNTPPIKMPDFMKIIGAVSLKDIDKKHPLPIIMMDEAGKPMRFPQQISEGYSGGRSDFFTILGIQNSIGATLLDSSGQAYSGSNPLPITGTLSTTPFATYFASDAVLSVNVIAPQGQGDSATALRIIQAGDAVASVNVVGFTASIASIPTNNEGIPYNSDNPLPVSLASSTIPVIQVSGAINSVNLMQTNGNATPVGTGYQDNALRVVHATDVVVSVNIVSENITLEVKQLSGSVDSVFVTNPVGEGDAATALRTVLANNVVYSFYSQNPVAQGDSATALRVVHAGDVAISVATSSQGRNESDAGTLRVTIMTDTAQSTNVTTFNGSAPSQGKNETDPGTLRVTIMTDTAQSTNILSFNGNVPATGLNETNGGVLRVAQMTDVVSSVYANNPVGQGDSATALRVTQAGDVALSVVVTGFADSIVTYMARSTNPTAKADGADVRPMADLLGRQVMKPHQVRDLVVTAYVTLSTGTEATLLAASAGNKYDLLYIMGANTSSAAVQIDIRPVLAGNIIASLYIPGNSTAGVSLPTGWPVSDTGNAWTVDMPDITNSNVLLSALFSKET